MQSNILEKKYISDKFYTENYAKKNWRNQRNKQCIYYLQKLESENLFKSGTSVLDVGCGSGELCLLLKNKYKVEASGVEINKTAIREAQALKVKVKYANLEKVWPYYKGVFDCVVGIEIIEHLVNPDHFLQESRRILKNKGSLVLTTPNLAAWFNRMLFLLGYQPFFLEASTVDKTIGLKFTRKLTPNRTPVGHVRCFTPKAITELLNLHGFKKVKIIGGHVDCFPEPMSTVDKIFSLIPNLSSDMIIIAKP